MDNSMRHNGHQVVDELRRLKILRAPHPPYSPDISPCDFWMFVDFVDLKRKLRDCHLQGPEEILTAFQELRDNITFEELQMTFESWRDRLRCITEHDEEYFHRWHICKSAIS
jgi:histone-lysine N-methyltransferase SETMAR